MGKTNAKQEKRPRVREPATVSFPCTTFKQAKHEFVLFLADAKKLWDVVEVNQRAEDKDEGYQRVASPSRVKKIAAYIDAERPLPSSVLISFDEANLSRDKTKITIPNIPGAGWVIDGQHRLAGAHQSNTSIPIPVVATIGLALEDQINLFVVINREQVGVPSSLYYELLKKLPSKKTETEIVQERAADLAALLKRDEESPFFSRIVTVTSPKRGEISLTNFVRKLAPLVRRDGRLSIYNDEERAGILNNYYRALEAVFHKEYLRSDSVFLKTIGFGALMNILPNFLDLTIQAYHKFRVADAIKVFSAVKHFNFENWHQLGTGNAAELQAAEDMRTELRDAQQTQTIDATIQLE